MSRIGRMPIEIPAGVEVKFDGSQVVVTGPKGQLSRAIHPDISVSKEDGRIIVSRPTDNRIHRSLHGLTRALIANMVVGVSEGYSKRLEIVGVGFRAEVRGSDLVLEVGYSHPVVITPPQGTTISVERGARIVVVEGIDKEVVGDLASKIRAVREPEPYKGKGIRYENEWVRRKAGKAGKVRQV